MKKFVIDTFGVNAQVHDAGCTVIPTEIDKEIPVERFQDWLHNSVQAVWAGLDLKLGAEAPPFTLAEFGIISGPIPENMTFRLMDCIPSSSPLVAFIFIAPYR